MHHTKAMKIEATQYTREDGVVMFRTDNGRWLIRMVLGPTWFYNVEKNTWMVGTALTSTDLLKLSLTRDQAHAVLAKVSV